MRLIFTMARRKFIPRDELFRVVKKRGMTLRGVHRLMSKKMKVSGYHHFTLYFKGKAVPNNVDEFARVLCRVIGTRNFKTVRTLLKYNGNFFDIERNRILNEEEQQQEMPIKFKLDEYVKDRQ